VLSGHIRQHRAVLGVLQKIIAGSESNPVISSSSTSQQLTQLNVLQFNVSLLWLKHQETCSSIKRLRIDLPGNIRDGESVWYDSGLIAASTTVLWTTKPAADAD